MQRGNNLATNIDKVEEVAYNIIMKKAQAYLNRLLIVSIVLTVLFVGGIPSLIVGAVNEIWPLMGVGIACTAVGFYAMPVAWSIYASARPVKRVVYAVTEEHLYTVHEIALQLSMDERNVRAHLDKCFNKGFLIGYKREGDNIVLNENVAAGKKEMFAECPYCGAKFTYTRDNARCPYCGSPVAENK